MQLANSFTNKWPSAMAKYLSLLVTSAALMACGDGTDGSTALVSTVAVPAGTVCAGGGTKVQVGKDTNKNGILETDEVLSSSVVCNGLDGAAGAQGPQGPQGPKGDNATFGE